ncbi:MAG: DUF3604 domain-containing protein [Deltaproteobacteria bacterium]|nr:DUF3604 domain-containing protein [Deltaproteobacteria bacterium]
MAKWKKVGLVAAALVVAVLVAGYVIYGGGKLEGRGVVSKTPVPFDEVLARLARQNVAKRAAGVEEKGAARQILFGDLHVHSTFSADAFLMSLPLLAGEGAHPPADACDFARYCSQIDFFAMTDHASSLTPRRWRETKQSVRECNAVADPEHPDVVAFSGWEWTHIGRTPEEHYGHRNVIFRGTGEDELPTRPIAALGFAAKAFQRGSRSLGIGTLLSVPIHDFENRQRYLDLAAAQLEIRGVDTCPTGVGVKDLPEECLEYAATPKDLFAKLAEWGLEAQVIPHGMTWGFYTPPGYSWDKQLAKEQDDPERQRVIEIYSGHGNSEEYRPWRAVEQDAEGNFSCPEPTPDYEPCCYRAGEIIRSRCGDAPADECERRVKEARQRHAEAGAAAHLTVPGATVEDWKDCGQCRDCFEPAFNYRPGGSAQYILAKGDFTDPEAPYHLTLGFIASSDNHKSRGGTGYKEYQRRLMTEATGARSKEWHERVFARPLDPAPESVPFTDELQDATPPWLLVHTERQASFFLTGGLVAIHAEGRGRDAIWEAMKRREVYGTSGPRILLWFDLINGPNGSKPMGSDVRLGLPPRFTVRALGAYKQQPGCPAWSALGLTPERRERLCAGECYHPSDERHAITRIEVVRIRPQQRADEPVAKLIEDVYRRFDCPPGKPACVVEFEDPDFVTAARDALYYVRAIQEPTPTVNAKALRCDRDEAGNCTQTRPCYGDYRTPLDEDCLEADEHRAWSSPVYLRFDAAAAKQWAADQEAAATDQDEEKNDEPSH